MENVTFRGVRGDGLKLFSGLRTKALDWDPGQEVGQMLTEIANRLTAVWHWTTDDPVSFYTAILAVSTIALWIVTWRGIRRQSKDTRTLERAYVNVEPGGLTAHRDRDDRLHT